MGRAGNIGFSFFPLNCRCKTKQAEALAALYLHPGMLEVYERNAAIIFKEGSRAAQ